MSSKDFLLGLFRTPIPTLLFIAGIPLVFIAIGGKIVAGVDTSNVNTLAAGLLGSVFIAASIGMWFVGHKPERQTVSTKSEAEAEDDPFLKYYMVSAVAFAAVFWLAVANLDGQSQLEATLTLFLLTGVVATVVVLWRTFDVRRYVRAQLEWRKGQNEQQRAPKLVAEPGGLLTGRHRLFLYFLLLVAELIVVLVLLLFYTRDEPNQANLVPALVSLAALSGYLALLRLFWEVADSQVDRLAH